MTAIMRSSGSVLVLACLAMTGEAAAQDRWDWIVTPYLWAVQVDTDLKLSPTAPAAISRQADFGQIVDKLDGAFQVHAEGQGENLGVFVDFTYLGLSDTAGRRLFHANSDLDTRLFEAALVWSPADERYTGADVFAGLRYIDLDIASDVTPSGPLALPPLRIELDESFSDFMVGARYTWSFANRWGVTLRGDGSWGQTEGTWNASVIANYKVKSGAWFFGYRYLDIEAEAHGVATDLSIHGPALGYGFRF